MYIECDIGYFMKSPTNAMLGANDQIAFYSEVPGYFPSSGAQSPISLVGLRMNSDKGYLERMGKGLLWNGVAGANAPMVFLPLTIKDVWPAAASQDADSDYELFGPNLFRFEYGYILKGRTLADGTALPSIYSATPWDTRTGVAHTAVCGFQDVSAIVALIAVLDPKSRILVGGSEPSRVAALKVLAGNMADFDPVAYPNPGDMEKQWQSAIDTSGFPKPAIAAMRIYRRTFPLGH